MAYNQMLQNTIEGVKAIARTDLCIMDSDANIIASTKGAVDEYKDSAMAFVKSPAEIQVVSGNQYFKIMENGQLEYIMLMCGDSDDLYTIGKLVVFQIQSLLAAYKERFDKENFIKNVLLDNMLLVDMHSKAKKLRIDTEARRAVFVIETIKEKDSDVMDIIKNLFAGNSKDFITAVDERSIIFVKELKENEDYTYVETVAKTIVDMLGSEAMTKAYVAYGNIVDKIKDISKSFKEARMALDVGRIFNSEKSISAYNKLGIGRLIYQLPMSLCRMFIDEIFPEITPDDFDDETLLTINKFFENSLNVSETARQLYIHRNTLVYRLDKVHKSTGLDLRVFEDAITFEIALMVVKYMKFMEESQY